MKTYFTFCVLSVVLFFGCSKSETVPPIEEGEVESVDVDYVTLLNANGKLKPQLLQVNDEVITLNLAESTLQEKSIPELTSVAAPCFLQYHKDGNCGGEVTIYNYLEDSASTISVFDDLDDCSLQATAIAKTDNSLFVAYLLEDPVNGTEDYFVRHIDLGSSSSNPIDIDLTEKPVGLAIANNRLFILTFDELISDENTLFVLDMATNSLIHEKNLGFNAKQVFTDGDDNIIISYDELHTTVNSSTLAFEFTQYDGIEPKFSNAKTLHFDTTGKLYYDMEPGENSQYPLVPATYDFSKQLITLFAYENFLTETERDFEFEIETTTAVAYDEENKVLLVGYKKMNTSSKTGGLMRIQVSPNLKLLDNIDLDGIPSHILVK